MEREMERRERCAWCEARATYGIFCEECASDFAWALQHGEEISAEDEAAQREAIAAQAAAKMEELRAGLLVERRAA